jgi:hypothetical protein
VGISTGASTLRNNFCGDNHSNIESVHMSQRRELNQLRHAGSIHGFASRSW